MAKVLVVDDAHEIRDLVMMILTDEGFSVAVCDTAEEALDRLVLAPPDVLILDGRLPGISGWACLERLRLSERTTTLPVVMLTGAMDDLKRAQLAPPDACTRYLGKPFDLEALLAAVHAVIESCDCQPAVV